MTGLEGEAMSHETDESTQTHTVRPRWTWIALVVMIAGLVLIGVGIVALSWTWAIPGLILLVIGGAAALYGGFFYDVQGGAAVSAQMHEVAEGNTYEFPGAGTMRSEAEVKQDVRDRWLSDGE
jgi:glucan phosphoethanolaminetransferase (alkaline phosphatase superfamily)